MPELISSQVVEKLTSAFLYHRTIKEVRPIKTSVTYQDLIGMFGSKYEMPPADDFDKGDENEYRCPYIPSCLAGAKCFAVATPVPLQENDVLNVTCRLCGNRKILIYAGKAHRSIKK